MAVWVKLEAFVCTVSIKMPYTVSINFQIMGVKVTTTLTKVTTTLTKVTTKLTPPNIWKKSCCKYCPFLSYLSSFF